MADSYITIVQKMMLSGFASITAEIITFPIDTTKIRMQIQSHKTGHKENNLNKQKGMINTAYNMLTKEGVSSFYKGSGFALFRAFVNTSISMSLYKPILNMIYKENSNKQTPLYPKIISASISGALTQLIACPVDVIKVRLQADGHLLKPRYKKTIDPLIKIFRHGILKFWTGLLPSIQRSTISAGCTISTYSHSKQLLINKLNYADNLLCHVISSFISGFVASLFSCPFDVIKTNIQFQSMSKPKYTNIFQCIRYITRREGVRGIFKGFLPIYYRLGPWQLIFFCTYEQLSKICTGDYF